jgi:hypothetical protein
VYIGVHGAKLVGMKSDKTCAVVNEIIAKWNARQPFLLITDSDVRNIYVRPHNSEGWQRYIAIDVEFNVDDGPFGFGKTEHEALSDLVSNPRYQTLIAQSPADSLPPVAPSQPDEPDPTLES